MRFRMQESQFGAPRGRYLARFDGVAEMPPANPPRLGKDGKPMGPAFEWKFTITADPAHGGQFVGREIGRITGQTPTKGNACGALLSGVLGREPGLNEDVDVSGCVGKVYEVFVDPQRDNPEKTQVTRVEAAPNGAQAQPPAAPRPPQAPRPPAPAAPNYSSSGTTTEVGAPAGRRFLVAVHPDKEAVEMGDAEVRAHLEATMADPAKLFIAPLGTQAWQPAASYGFKSATPF